MSNLLTYANTLNSNPHMDLLYHNDNSTIASDNIGSWLPLMKSNKNSNSAFGLSQQWAKDVEAFDYSSPDEEKLFQSFFPFLEDTEEKLKTSDSLLCVFATDASFTSSGNCSTSSISTNSLSSSLQSQMVAIDHLSLEKEMLDQTTSSVLISKENEVIINNSPVFVSELSAKNEAKFLENNQVKEYSPSIVPTVIERFKNPIVPVNHNKDKFESWNPFGSHNAMPSMKEIAKVDISVKAIGSEMSQAKKMGLIKNGCSQKPKSLQDMPPNEIRTSLSNITNPAIQSQSISTGSIDQNLINSLSKLLLSNNVSGLPLKPADVQAPLKPTTINSFKLPSPIMNATVIMPSIDSSIPQDLIDFLKFFTASGLIPEHLLKPKNMNPAFFAAAKQFMQLCKAYAGLLTDVQKGNRDNKSVLLLELLQSEIRRGREDIISRLLTAEVAATAASQIHILPQLAAPRQQSTCWLRLTNFPVSDPPTVKSLLGRYGRIVELRNQDGCKYAVKFSTDLELMAAWASLSQSSTSCPHIYQSDLVNDLGEIILR